MVRQVRVRSQRRGSGDAASRRGRTLEVDIDGPGPPLGPTENGLCVAYPPTEVVKVRPAAIDLSVLRYVNLTYGGRGRRAEILPNKLAASLGG